MVRQVGADPEAAVRPDDLVAATCLERSPSGQEVQASASEAVGDRRLHEAGGPVHVPDDGECGSVLLGRAAQVRAILRVGPHLARDLCSRIVSGGVPKDTLRRTAGSSLEYWTY